MMCASAPALRVFVYRFVGEPLKRVVKKSTTSYASRTPFSLREIDMEERAIHHAADNVNDYREDDESNMQYGKSSVGTTTVIEWDLRREGQRNGHFAVAIPEADVDDTAVAGRRGGYTIGV